MASLDLTMVQGLINRRLVRGGEMSHEGQQGFLLDEATILSWPPAASRSTV
jgi:hypothetical protein